MKINFLLVCSLIAALCFSFSGCHTEPQIVEKPVTVTKEVYICPKCLKEYDTKEEAADCCGVQREIVEQIVTEVEFVESAVTTEPVTKVCYYLKAVDSNYFSYKNCDYYGTDDIEIGTELKTLAKSYDGFTARGFIQQGSKVYIFYTRNIIRITLLNEDLTTYKLLEGEYGSTVETVANPEKENCHFEEWVINEESTEIPSTYPMENLVLAAKFHHIKTYTITYSTAKGTAPASKTVICEQKISAAEKPRMDNVTAGGTEYRFVGWYKDSAFTQLFNGTLKESITVYAKWVDATNILGTMTAPEKVGDIVLSDGSACSATDELSEEQIENAVAVVFYAGSDEDLLGNKMLGVGIHLNNNNTLPWAKSGTTGANCRFEKIEVSTGQDFYLGSSTYTGDNYGGDNWEYICTVDPEGTQNPAENYPVFNEVLNYVSNYETGIFNAGWYLPSFPELVELKRNVSTVNQSLSKVIDVVFADAHWYWSSSTYSSDNSECYEFNLINRTNCTIGRTYTTENEMSVCAVIELK